MHPGPESHVLFGETPFEIKIQVGVTKGPDLILPTDALKYTAVLSLEPDWTSPVQYQLTGGTANYQFANDLLITCKY